ncbi:MAG TPA: N-acetyl-gamma-glutamyl-phosphate reductase [Burkholderiales bacterium]|jgi:N-acetyl-gamma-glutamyl-phosphate reductase|nr:N-acetyl-gamma-glutamyl-phosphate reductase [Burkholderiales bacterium]
MKIGIVGVSGYGGSELLRLCVGHPSFEIAYVGGDSTAGQSLAQRFPALADHPAGKLTIQPFVPERVGVELLFVSLPTGKSREPLAKVPREARIVDVGGDHRFVEGWTYGLTELPGQRERIRSASRLANPGCYPAAALLALAPLVKEGLIEPEGIVIDAKSGITGTGRGGASDFGYAETNEDVFAYGLEAHPHVPEMEQALSQIAGRKVSIAFTPHLVPMTRGILATCYARPRGAANADRLRQAARSCYRDEPFVKIVESANGRSAHTGWATGSNLAFLSYAVNSQTGLVVAIGAIDNLGKGASAQAVQNANLMAGQPETAGLSGLPLWP